VHQCHWLECTRALCRGIGIAKICRKRQSRSHQSRHPEFRDLESDDPNFPSIKDSPDENYYRVLIDKSQEEIVAKLEELKALNLRPRGFQGMKAIWFGRHLYEPLVYLSSNIVEISPVALNKGERTLIEDLRAFYDNEKELFSNKEFYLLRNLSKGRGVGFFEAGNFYPDFILWVLMNGRQHIAFVDPKGIRNLGPTDPKIQFYSTIKEIEQRLGDPSVKLSSFIISNTSSHTMKLLWRMDKSEMEARHILFQEEDKDTYFGRCWNASWRHSLRGHDAQSGSFTQRYVTRHECWL